MARSKGDSVGYMRILAGEGRDVEEALGACDQLLGESLVGPLIDALEDGRTDIAVLVPTGPLALLPFEDLLDGHGRSLGTSSCAFVYGLNANTHILLREHQARQARGHRARKTEDFYFIADPQPHPKPLPGARKEAAAVSKMVVPASILSMDGEMATREAVMDELRKDHGLVHFSCHSHASVAEDPLGSSLSLGGGESLTVRDILLGTSMDARLTILSACDTGVQGMNRYVDEAVSLGSVFCGVGSVGAIASRWRISDYPTALLMVRFYEICLDNGVEPWAWPSIAIADSLGRAKEWLAKLTVEQEVEWLENHPALKSLLEEQLGQEVRTPGTENGSRRFRDRRYWAGFSLWGA